MEKDKEVDFQSFQHGKKKIAHISNLDVEHVQNITDATVAKQELDTDINEKCQVLLPGSMVVKQAMCKVNAIVRGVVKKVKREKRA